MNDAWQRNTLEKAQYGRVRTWTKEIKIHKMLSRFFNTYIGNLYSAINLIQTIPCMDSIAATRYIVFDNHPAKFSCIQWL